MPYYGNPSQGCSSCRQRRIKCDRVDPICSQCKRGNKKCGGYRDISSLLFRNENDKTARRSAEAKAKTMARRELEDAALESNTSSPGPRFAPTPSEALLFRRAQLFLVAPRIVAPLSSSAEELGLKFFVARFGTPEVTRPDGSPHTLQPSHFFGAIHYDQSARDAVVSVGLAAMSNVTRDKAMRILSREKHATVINAVQKAVSNPAQANPDSTFHKIVMLSLYEMVSCSSDQVDRWTVHLDGAAALLRQSTFKRAMTTLDHRAQLQFYFASLVKYFLPRRDIPPDLLKWSPKIMESAPHEILPAVNLVDILIRFMKFDVSLRAKVHDPRTVATSAALFEIELRDWEASLPENWSFVAKYTDKTDNRQHTFHGQFHIYRDIWVSRVFNHYRWGRALVNELILSQVSSIKWPTADEFVQRQQALDTISCMTIDICVGAASQEALSQRGAVVECPSHVPPLNGIFMLLFPLAVAGGIAGVSDEVHEWVIATLERIGCTMGIQRAIEMIPELKRNHGQWKLDQERWKQIYMA
ncbi:Chondroitin AC/alginate lyase [Penicillium nucicola]|uniref:Chondroitin AC/alginate lyase n=1 Tax=Penicillium nucicola TaxID=1850975 RepID=UPI0025456165|nr:Chondroitin AC/alginate lyase [Penicillium nucicola]KAJ5753447.1 Chondroitin AC/alginate lyase [Penicillium nucicola]